MKIVFVALAMAVMAAHSFAKLPPPPPKAPEVVEAEKVKAADARAKGAELQAKYEDKAVANYAAKARAEGKEFKPQLVGGVQPPVAPMPVAPVAAAPVGAKPAAAPPPVKK